MPSRSIDQLAPHQLAELVPVDTDRLRRRDAAGEQRGDERMVGERVAGAAPAGPDPLRR